MLKCLLEHGGNPDAVILERSSVVLVALNALIDKPKNPIYKDVCKLLIKHKADISMFKHSLVKHQKYITIIEMLKAEITQEEIIDLFHNLPYQEVFEENTEALATAAHILPLEGGYVSDANTETKTGSRLVEIAKSQFFSLNEIKALGEDTPNLDGDT
ncbi:hypothetical protein [Rickettsia asembonensis]|uniref:hypothetical protein n=1 Tax=Rickettsia asembonensis TaxID=1068590 RepID=UPI000694B169|nr:hypothetical protein [Rickettsia asembonensis]